MAQSNAGEGYLLYSSPATTLFSSLSLLLHATLDLEAVQDVGQLVPLKMSAKADHHAAKHGRFLLQRLQSPPLDAQSQGHVPDRYLLYRLRFSDSGSRNGSVERGDNKRNK